MFIGLVAAVFRVSFDWDQNDAFGAGGSGHIALTVLFLLFFFSFGLLRTLFIDVALLKRACETMTVDNPQDLDRVIQSPANLPSHGEGLADARGVMSEAERREGGRVAVAPDAEHAALFVQLVVTVTVQKGMGEIHRFPFVTSSAAPMAMLRVDYKGGGHYDAQRSPKK